jgi:hypothetical protein
MPPDGSGHIAEVLVEELSPPDTVTDPALRPYLDTLRGRYLQPRAGDEGRIYLTRFSLAARFEYDGLAPK